MYVSCSLRIKQCLHILITSMTCSMQKPKHCNITTFKDPPPFTTCSRYTWYDGIYKSRYLDTNFAIAIVTLSFFLPYRLIGCRHSIVIKQTWRGSRTCGSHQEITCSVSIIISCTIWVKISSPFSWDWKGHQFQHVSHWTPSRIQHGNAMATSHQAAASRNETNEGLKGQNFAVSTCFTNRKS